MRHLAVVLIAFVLLLPAPAAGGDSVSLDPALRVLLARPAHEVEGLLAAARAGGTRPVIPRALLGAVSAGPPHTLEVFLESADPARVAAETEGRAIELGGGRYAARITVEGLRRLVGSGAVAAARLSRPVRPALDRSGPYLGVDRARRYDPVRGQFEGATGRGAVVGIVDSGVDWSHPDFQLADGRTRIHRLWDQTVLSSTPPAGFHRGVEYSGFYLDRVMGPGPDLSGHGTHVLGAAAGNGFADLTQDGRPRYCGVAPEASLIVVRTGFTEYGVVTGANYIFQRARALGLPAVVNLSLGNSYGPHRGTTPFEESLRELVGPGNLIVAAAGNDGHRDLHAEVSLAVGERTILRLDVPTYDRDFETIYFTDFQGWFDPANRYRFILRDPEGREVGSINRGTENVTFEGPRGIVRGWHTEDLGLGALWIEIEDNYDSVRGFAGAWTLEIEALAVAGDPELDFWVVNWRTNRGEYPRFLDHVDRRETLLIPATAPRIIAVGAVSTRGCWPDAAGGQSCYETAPVFGQTAYFSSIGPTPDGREKPEILAPGHGVISARSTTISSERWTSEELEERGTPDGRYLLNQGTSMAAPQVTGAVALLLERHPTMTPEQAVVRLRARARPGEDPRTGDAIRILDVGNAVAPAIEIVLSDVFQKADGVHLRWFAGKARGEAWYRVYKGFSDEGPFHLLAERPLTGGNNFEIVDRAPEAGRLHVYRIAAWGEAGLEDDLDTLRVQVPGTPAFVFRAPDPNPARSDVNLRFFLPPTVAGGGYGIDVLDVGGRRVRALEQGSFGPEGEERRTRWDLRDDQGRRVAAGLYFLRLEAVREPAPGTTKAGTPVTEVRRVVVLP